MLFLDGETAIEVPASTEKATALCASLIQYLLFWMDPASAL